MIKNNRGLAAIPLILMFAIMVIAIPLAINQSQKVTTLQNKAANYAQIGQMCSLEKQIFCVDGLYCDPRTSTCVSQGSAPPTVAPGAAGSVSCSDITSLRSQYCPAGRDISPRVDFLSCDQLEAMYQQFCRVQATPTRGFPSVVPTTNPIAKCETSRPTCVNGNAYLDPGARCVQAPCCVWRCPSPAPTRTGTSPVPTSTAGCKPGEGPKKVGSFIFVCINGSWRYQPNDIYRPQ